MGPELDEIEKIGLQLEQIVKPLPGTRSVYAERVSGGYFVDVTLKREQLARYGLTVEDAEMIIMSAVGGENVTTAIQGPERYGVNVRYARDYRDDLEKLQRVLVPTMSGAQIPLGAIADINVSLGPSMIRDENGMMAGYVYVDLSSKDIGGYVNQAKQAVRDQLQLPAGLFPPVERPVREHAAGARAAEGDHSLDAPDHLRAAVPEHQERDQGRHRPARGPVLADRGDLAAVSPGLQHVDRSLGRHDRFDGLGRGDGRLHAAVSGFVV